MHLLDLPSETLDAVCSFLAAADLAGLVVAHPRLSAVARRLLYHTVAVYDWAYNRASVITLANNPAIAQDVRHFEVWIPPCDGTLPAYFRLLRTALRNMTALTSLGVFIGVRASWVLQDLGPFASYPQLRTFTCDFLLDASVLAFLHRCPSIQILQLGSAAVSSAPDALPTSELPSLDSLESFVGACNVALRIIPGRSVKSVRVTDGDLHEDTLRAISRSTAVVEIFDAIMGDFSLNLLRSIAEHLQGIIHLRLSVLKAFDAVPDNVFVTRIADILTRHFPRLSSFELSGIHWSPCLKADGQVKGWQQAPMPTLPIFGEGFMHEEAHGDVLDAAAWTIEAW